MKKRLSLVLTGLLALSMFSVLANMSVLADTVDEYLRTSDAQEYMMIGDVKEIECRWEDDLIYSYVTIFAKAVESGPEDLEGKEIIVKHIGGGIDGVGLWQSDQAYFTIGETVRVHLQRELEAFTVIGGPEGKMSLDSELKPVEEYTVAGYKLQWYKPPGSWQTATERPGPDWYGPRRWNVPAGGIPYRINPAGSTEEGIPEATFIDYVKKSYQTWEDDPTSTIDYTYAGTTTNAWGVNDGVNIFCWEYYDPGIVGVCRSYVTYITGDYDSLRNHDCDVLLNTLYDWSAGPTCPTDKYDVQNVGTHEDGHVCGLGDLYDAEDADQTMYGYVSEGETKKRDLNWGDTAGIYALYPGCFIATAAYGSELSPEVQFLRGFRNQIAMDTFVGAEGVALFNKIYFSFSPNVAQFIAAHPTIRATVKTMLYPLVGIVHVSAATYSLFTFNHELGVTVAALLGSSLIGATYCAPWAMLIIKLVERYKKKTLRIASFKPFAVPWLIGFVLMCLASVTLSGPLMTTAITMLILTTTATSALAVALALTKGVRLLRDIFRFAAPIHHSEHSGA